MSRYVTRSGIVLRRNVLPGGDVILSILAPNGKFKGIAREGAKGQQSPRLNLFQHLTVQLYQRPGSDLAMITQIVLEGALAGLSNPEIYPYAHFLAELADQLYQEGDVVGQTGFELLAGGMRGLHRHPDPNRVALVMAWKLLGANGLYPRVMTCIETGETATLTHFDPMAGGATHQTIAQGMEVGEDAILELQLMARGTVREVLETPLDFSTRTVLWRMLEAYLVAQVGRLQTWEAVRQLQRQDADLHRNARPVV